MSFVRVWKGVYRCGLKGGLVLFFGKLNKIIKLDSIVIENRFWIFLILEKNYLG